MESIQPEAQSHLIYSAPDAPIHYYTDPLNEDFSGIKRPPLKIGEDFPFLRRGWWWKLRRFFVYRVVMTPIAFLYSKIRFSVQFVNRSALKPFRREGYFLYGNHTQVPGDAFIPNIMCFPKDLYFIVHPDNLATPGTRSIMQMLGAIPTPTEIKALRPFTHAIERQTLDGNGVVIFPEAHIWPYYTGIRPFKTTSFKYPANFSVPVFCFTTTYQRRKCRTPRITVYIDGPFYPDPALSAHAQAQQLRDQVYETMCRRAQNSDYAMIRYQQRVPRTSAEEINERKGVPQ